MQLDISAPLRLRVTGKSAGAALDTLETERVPAGEVWEIHNVAYLDRTTNCTSAFVYIGNHGYKHYRSYTNGPVAGRLYQDPYSFLLGEGESVVVDLVGCTNNDLLELFVDGARLIEA